MVGLVEKLRALVYLDFPKRTPMEGALPTKVSIFCDLTERGNHYTCARPKSVEPCRGFPGRELSGLRKRCEFT